MVGSFVITLHFGGEDSSVERAAQPSEHTDPLWGTDLVAAGGGVRGDVQSGSAGWTVRTLLDYQRIPESIAHDRARGKETAGALHGAWESATERAYAGGIRCSIPRDKKAGGDDRQ